jgi:hypothetical protein
VYLFWARFLIQININQTMLEFPSHLLLNFYYLWISCKDLCKCLALCNVKGVSNEGGLVYLQHTRNKEIQSLTVCSKITGISITKIIVVVSEMSLYESWKCLVKYYENLGNLHGITWFNPSMSVSQFLCDLQLESCGTDTLITCGKPHDDKTTIYSIKKGITSDNKIHIQFGSYLNKQFIGWAVRAIYETKSNLSIEVYYGQVDDTLPHGRGARQMTDGTTYSGHWNNGKREGNGIIISPIYKSFINAPHYGFTYDSGVWHNDELMEFEIRERVAFVDKALTVVERNIFISKVYECSTRGDITCFALKYFL